MQEEKIRKNILVVDDERLIRLIVMKIFKNEFNVIEAIDGYDALEKLDEIPNISLVILDLSMPNLNGYDVMEKMKENPAMANVPVIVITANDDDDESQIKALDFGAMDVITKPFSPPIVLRRIRNTLDKMETQCVFEQNKQFRMTIKEQEERIKIAEIDEVTGLLNTSSFFRRANEAISANTNKRFVIVRWLLIDLEYIMTYMVKTMVIIYFVSLEKHI